MLRIPATVCTAKHLAGEAGGLNDIRAMGLGKLGLADLVQSIRRGLKRRELTGQMPAC